MFSLICVSVIVMRESGIESYDPGYKSPLYPWMQIFGIFSPLILISQMGAFPLIFTFGLIAFGTGWYYWYAREKVHRRGAIFHIFERLGQHRFSGLERELRGILMEKGLRGTDPFYEVIARAPVIFLSKKNTFKGAILLASERLAQNLPYSAEELSQRILEGTKLGITPVTYGIALPHLRLQNIENPRMVLLQCRTGIRIEDDMEIPDFEGRDKPIHAIFFLVSPQEHPGQHLRILANLAARAEDEKFMENWLSASSELQLKELFLKDKHFLSIHIKEGLRSAQLIGQAMRDLNLPENCLVAFIQRFNKTIIPRGSTVLNEMDSITFIGEPPVIEELHDKFGGYKRKKSQEEG